MARVSLLLVPKLWVLLSVSALAFIAAFAATSHSVVITASAMGGSLLLLAVTSALVAFRFRSSNSKAQRTIAEFVCHDSAACFVADEVGAIWYRNEVAQEKFDPTQETTIATLASVLSNPSAIVTRLSIKANELGAAREDVVTLQGHLRLSCHALTQGGTLWRVEELPKNAGSAAGDNFEKLPILTVGRNDTVLYMNEVARRMVGERVKTLDRVFVDLPITPGKVHDVSTASGNVPCVVAELAGSAGRRELVLVPTPQRHVELPENMRFFDELPVPLLKLSPDGRVTSSNRMARDLLGRNEVDGELLSTLLEGLGRSIRDWLQDTASGRVSHQSEFLKVRRDDFETFVQVVLKPAVEDGQDVVVAVLNDATELKTLEAQFVQSQKMQAIGQLAGGVAHDFNNLLTAISGHCDLLMLRRSEDDSDYADLEQISQNANRAAALVSQLLAFSRKQTLRPQTINVQETLSDLTHLLNRLVGEKVQLDFEHVTGSHTIRADKRQIEQVVMNLVVNARDAMQAGGKITISTQPLVLEQPLKRDRAKVPAGEYVAVKVMDQGSGISLDKLQKIFEPFFTTKRTGEGTGLGLSTAYGIVKQTGGFIFADSEEGKGSCFTLIFPEHVPDETAPAVLDVEQSHETHIKNDGGVILLVEDEAPVRAFASRALSLSGFSVMEASSGEEALEVLSDSSLQIEAYVTDVVMPGLDGPSWVREAMKTRPDVKVVFMSGYAEDVFGENGPGVPEAAFLQKPFSLSELTSTVQNLLLEQESIS
ncbi:response regulator [Lentibacter algarum]|nr:response regulator [Lentibacter algarum]